MPDNAETIVCPSCGAINRAPASRLAAGERPSCGGCRKPLFEGVPHDVSGEEGFNRLIGDTSIPVLVDFWAEWCGPCLQMAPHFKAAAQALEPRVRLVKVDTETLPVIAGRHGIKSIPTLILFSKGREIGRQSGAMQAKAIEQWVSQRLSQA
jgi:thioredoxin 2